MVALLVASALCCNNPGPQPCYKVEYQTRIIYCTEFNRDYVLEPNVPKGWEVYRVVSYTKTPDWCQDAGAYQYRHRLEYVLVRHVRE